jgi:hypothetical protein
MPEKIIKDVINQTLENDILMRSIKILDIGYVFCFYYTLAVICAIITNKYLEPFDSKKYDKLSTKKITIEILLLMWMYGILCYIARNLIALIPFPLDVYQGYQHKKIREIRSTWAFSAIYLVCATNLRDRVVYVFKRYQKIFN